MASAVTLMIDTPQGQIVRTIRAATAVPREGNDGAAIEEATRSAASRWGLPDFVFEPAVQAKGAGVVEVGDGIILVGKHAVVPQVKSRNGQLGNTDRETSWLTKAIAKGLRQGAGTIRQLGRVPMQVTNARGNILALDGSSVHWLSVVVIDHDGVPDGFTPLLGEAPAPQIVLLRRDWEFLFNHLRSTFAVVEYLARVADEVIPLGEEPVRYHQLALADLDAKPSAPAKWSPEGSVLRSVPLLPLEPAGSDDERAHLLLRIIFEDIAQIRLSEAFDERNRLQALAALDNMPVGHRSELGQVLFRFMDEMQATPVPRGSIRSRTRTAVPPRLDAPLLVFMIANEKTEMTDDLFRVRLMTRHYEVGLSRGGPEQLSVGVLLTPDPFKNRPWDTTLLMITGELEIGVEELADYRAFLGSGLVQN